ncbi:ArgP/LysG family DNA-binding transcriptional regulator, partial [Escherichia coli]
TPFLVFNRKDDCQVHWVEQAFGVREPRLRERFVPSSEAYVQAALMGWGVGVAPEIQVRPFIEAGRLAR